MGVVLLTLGLFGCALIALPALAPLRAWAAPLALGYGVALGLGLGAAPGWTKGASRTLLQVAVVGLGLTLPLGEVLREGGRSVLVALVTIGGTLGLAYWLGRRWGVPSGLARLLGVGTAICGGSAIAAVAAATDAPPEETAVATATVFCLNAATMLVLPPLGHALGLNPTEFGRWAGIAVHDVASVAGAAAAFAPASLGPGMTVKMARVLYLAPITFLYGGRTFPWFVLGFMAAAGARALWPALPDVRPVVTALFAAALLLTGRALTRQALAQVGPRPLQLALVLWLALAGAGLLAARTT